MTTPGAIHVDPTAVPRTMSTRTVVSDPTVYQNTRGRQARPTGPMRMPARPGVRAAGAGMPGVVVSGVLLGALPGVLPVLRTAAPLTATPAIGDGRRRRTPGRR
jgi:hypothetical protein